MAARWIRLVVLTMVSTTLAAAAHSAGSGQPLPQLLAVTPLPMVLAAGAVSASAVAVLGWERRPVWLVALLLTVTQLGQHLVLLTAGHAPAVPAVPAHHGGSAGAGALGVLRAAGEVPEAAPGHQHLPIMLSAHLLAAALTAVLLGHGEHLTTLLLTLLGAVLRRVPSVSGPRWVPPDTCPLPPSQPVVTPADPLPGGGFGLRGPPVAPAQPGRQGDLALTRS